jgi:hypothetical protein
MSRREGLMEAVMRELEEGITRKVDQRKVGEESARRRWNVIRSLGWCSAMG